MKSRRKGISVAKPANEPLDHLADEELLQRFRQGHRAAFDLLVRRYERELFGYLRRYLGDANLADDVFQNTFLQLYLKCDQFEAGRPVRPWLYTIATNQAIDTLRRLGRQAMVSLDQQTGETAEGEVRSLIELIEGRAVDPAAHSEEEERRVRIRVWVDQLDDKLRQVLLLAYYQGLKYRDIAEILDIPVGTVKSRLHTALLRLQEAGNAEPSLPDL